MSKRRIAVTQNVDGWDQQVIGRVTYSENLDRWTGSNWENGGTGRHKGLARLKDDSYVVIHGTNWQGETDTAHIVTAQEAAELIVASGNLELLEDVRFRDLKEIIAAWDAQEVEV